LKIGDVEELRQLRKPPQQVQEVCEIVKQLLARVDPEIVVDVRGRVRDKSWKASQQMMTDPRRFIETLQRFKGCIDAGEVPPNNIIQARRTIVAMVDGLSYESMCRKSVAAANLTAWVIDIIAYYESIVPCEPVDASPEPRPMKVEGLIGLPDEESVMEGVSNVLPAKSSQALDLVDRRQIQELKSYKVPPSSVAKTMCAVMVVLGKKPTWAEAQRELSDATSFLLKLQNFSIESISDTTLRKIIKYTDSPDFDPQIVSGSSKVAGALCQWIHTVKYLAELSRTEAQRAAASGLEDVSGVSSEVIEKQGGVQDLGDLSAFRYYLSAASRASDAYRDVGGAIVDP
jgi:hypothetical protein